LEKSKCITFGSCLQSRKTVVDGAQWIIEGARNGTYHIVDRWSPEDGEIRALGLLILNDLAKMKLAAKEVY
jgi:hypothetical protein